MFQIAIARFGACPTVFPATYATTDAAIAAMHTFSGDKLFDRVLPPKTGDYCVVPAGMDAPYLRSETVRHAALATTLRDAPAFVAHPLEHAAARVRAARRLVTVDGRAGPRDWLVTLHDVVHVCASAAAAGVCILDGRDDAWELYLDLYDILVLRSGQRDRPRSEWADWTAMPRHGYPELTEDILGAVAGDQARFPYVRAP